MATLHLQSLGRHGIWPVFLETDNYRNVTSSTKPDVHNILHCFHRRTRTHLQLTRSEIFVKFGRTFFLNMRADRHTVTVITVLCQYSSSLQGQSKTDLDYYFLISKYLESDWCKVIFYIARHMGLYNKPTAFEVAYAQYTLCLKKNKTLNSCP